MFIPTTRSQHDRRPQTRRYPAAPHGRTIHDLVSAKRLVALQQNLKHLAADRGQSLRALRAQHLGVFQRVGGAALMVVIGGVVVIDMGGDPPRSTVGRSTAGHTGPVQDANGTCRHAQRQFRSENAVGDASDPVRPEETGGH